MTAAGFVNTGEVAGPIDTDGVADCAIGDGGIAYSVNIDEVADCVTSDFATKSAVSNVLLDNDGATGDFRLYSLYSDTCGGTIIGVSSTGATGLGTIGATIGGGK